MPMTDEYRDNMLKEILLQEHKATRKLNEHCAALEMEVKKLRNLADAVDAVRSFGCQYSMGMKEPDDYKNLATFNPASVAQLCSDVIAMKQELDDIRKRKASSGL